MFKIGILLVIFSKHLSLIIYIIFNSCVCHLSHQTVSTSRAESIQIDIGTSQSLTSVFALNNFLKKKKKIVVKGKKNKRERKEVTNRKKRATKENKRDKKRKNRRGKVLKE